MRKVLSIAAVLALAGCGLLDKDEHGYPELSKRSFIQSCTAANSNEAACTCALAEIEKLIPYEAFKDAEAALKAGKQMDRAVEQKMMTAIAGCASRK
ncbi:MAG: hypothetical protein AB7F98_06460 [Novosphingobium sp.]